MLKYMVGVDRIESVDLTVFVYPDSFLYKFSGFKPVFVSLY